MGASICWKPVERKEYPSLGVCAPQSFMEKCEKVFNRFPVELDEYSIPKIDTIIALEGKTSDFVEVRELIEKHGKIKLWAEY